MFLYPFSLHGIIQFGIFLFGLFLIGLIAPLVLRPFPPGGQHYGLLLVSMLRVPLIGYIAFYFGYCIFDSSKGGRRAPNIRPEHMPDIEDFVSQLFLILGCVAICFLHVAVYCIFTSRIDLVFWLLVGCGSFFFPMALLRGVLFDAVGALNPISIIGSIFKTFFAYCGLLLSLCIFGGVVVLIFLNLRRLPILGFVSNAVNLYLLFIAAHLVGRFYWWNKDKLNWGL